MNDLDDIGNVLVQKMYELYSVDSKKCKACLASLFISCYSFMDEKDRYNVLNVVLRLCASVGKECFEDGTDFVDFLTQAIKENGNND